MRIIARRPRISSPHSARCKCTKNGSESSRLYLGRTMEVAGDLGCFGTPKLMYIHVVYSILCDKVIQTNLTRL